MLNPKCAIYYFIASTATSSFAGMCNAVRGGTKAGGEGGEYPSSCFWKFGLELSRILRDLGYIFLPFWGASQGYICLGLRSNLRQRWRFNWFRRHFGYNFLRFRRTSHNYTSNFSEIRTICFSAFGRFTLNLSSISENFESYIFFHWGEFHGTRSFQQLNDDWKE